MRWIRARLQPFETAFAAIIVTQGVVALAGGALVDPASLLLPHWLVISFQVTYSLAGLLLLFGLFLPRGDVEGAGLVLLACTLLARAILYGQVLGWGLRSYSSLAFSLFLAAACGLRLELLISKPRWLVQSFSDDE